MPFLDLDDRPPCPVCGAEGGNCGPEGDHPGKITFEEWGGDPPTRSSRQKEKVLMANAVVATERIHERVAIPRSTRTRKVLRYGPGQVVAPEDVDRLNVRPDGTQSKVPTADAASDVVTPLAAKKKAPAKKSAARKATTKKAAPRKKAAAKKTAKKRA